MNDRADSKRTFKTKSIADIAGQVNNKVFRKFGFAKSDIIMHWRDIVGEVLSKSSIPERLITPRKYDNSEYRAGILHIRINGSFAPEMQHLEAMVIDRINAYYGFKAVEKLVFHHGVIHQNEDQKKYIPPILTDSQENELKKLLKDVKDPELRKSLYNVGVEIIGKRKEPEVRQIKRFTRRGLGSASIDE